MDFTKSNSHISSPEYKIHNSLIDFNWSGTMDLANQSQLYWLIVYRAVDGEI
jgi:hypothetical protein